MTGNALLRYYLGSTCVCGSWKAESHSFCRKHFDALGFYRRKALRRGFITGYEDQFRAALAELNLAEVKA
jgi:hypothetical protein